MMEKYLVVDTGLSLQPFFFISDLNEDTQICRYIKLRRSANNNKLDSEFQD